MSNIKLRQIADLLKFILSIDDEEIIQASLESIIEMIEDEIK